MKPARLIAAAAAAAAFLVLLVVGVGMWSLTTFQRFETRAMVEDPHWVNTQLALELGRFGTAYLEALTEPSARAMDNMELRFELLYSRVIVFHEAWHQEPLASIIGGAAQVPELEPLMPPIEASLAQWRRTGVAPEADLAAQLGRLQGEVITALRETTLEFNLAVTEERDGFFSRVAVLDGLVLILTAGLVVLLAYAIRQYRQAESGRDQLLETAAGLEKAHAEAREASRAKSQFLAQMSHELRTPLNAILGFSEAIKERVLGPDRADRYQEYASDIHVSGLHLLFLVNELLDLSKIEAGAWELEKEVVSVADEIDTVCRLVAPLAAQNDIQLSKIGCERQPALVADQRSVRQMILNLTSNAIRHAPPGSEVRICFEHRDLGAAITACDTGGTMDQDIQGLINAPWDEDAPDAYVRSRTGTGLGLTVTKILAAKHGATLFADSHPDSGTTIEILFPHPAALQAVAAAGE